MNSYKQSLLGFVKTLFIVTVILGVLQYILFEQVLKSNSLYYPTWVIYLFLFVVTLIMYSTILWVNVSFKEYTGYTFMASGLIKMLIMILFIWPLISNQKEGLYLNLASIFIPYFLFLITETMYAIKLLNQKS